MCFHIFLLIKGASWPLGSCSKSSGVGGSVASASAPIVSMIRLTQSSCSTLRGSTPPTTAPMKQMMSAEQFTVSCIASMDRISARKDGIRVYHQWEVSKAITCDLLTRKIGHDDIPLGKSLLHNHPWVLLYIGSLDPDPHFIIFPYTNLELQELADVVEDGAPPQHCFDNRGEVIIQDDDIRGLFGNFSACKHVTEKRLKRSS